jgi:hypothetical protein
MKGIIASAFADLAKILNNSENQALSSCLKKTNSTAGLKRKPDKTKMRNFQQAELNQTEPTSL